MLPQLEYSLKQSFEGVKPSSSPLVEEALSLGFIIKSITSPCASPFYELPLALTDYQVEARKVRLPSGHRFYIDCVREQEARLIEWGIKRFHPDCWFFTQTFKFEIHPEKALRFQKMFTARLAQAKYDVTRCEQLTYLTCGEWQQRGVFHYHSIFFGRGLASLSRKRWELRWLKLSEGFGSCYAAELKAAPYLAKHNLKSARYSDLQLGGDWRGLSLPARLGHCCSSACLEGETMPAFSKS